MSDAEGESDGLGSLAQSSRKQNLKTARTTMFVVGALTIAANLFLALGAEKMVDLAFEKEIQKVRNQGMEVDPAAIGELKAQAVKSTRLAGFGFAAVGGVFILLGLFVYKAPVACTVLALVLYIAGWAISAVADPAQIVAGLLIKIIIIAALGKAVQAAIAYQREAAPA
jgi:uncharacterized membrane protein YphA (DoxX/SURF4 family)